MSNEVNQKSKSAINDELEVSRYEIKKIALDNGLVQLEREFSHLVYKSTLDDKFKRKTGIDNMFLSEKEEERLNDIRLFLNDNPELTPLWLEAHRINMASYKRNCRLFGHISGMVSSNPNKVYFITFTFNDATLEKTTPITRRKYVSRWLKNNAIDYVANIDYGAKNHREHYHAVCLANDTMDYSQWHKLGALKSDPLRYQGDDEKKLAKYITKLGNHAIKETTKRCHLIYPKSTN